MVKLDSTKDYYAALELTSSADETDIKKAFRRLAFKYHPDRNPGRETEFNIKFQEIQAANEILTDAQTKAKYDAERARATLPTRARGYAPTSAFQSAQAKYPPPPRRTADPTARKPRPPPPPPPPQATKPRRPGPAVPPRNPTESKIPTGDGRTSSEYASPYGSYFQGRAGTFNTSGSASESDKARAWASMRSGPYQKTQSDDDMFANPSPKKSGFGDVPFNFQRTQRARADWDEPDLSKMNSSRTNSGLGRSQTQKTPKKTGFDPATPYGDEPPAQRANAYFHRPREQAQFYPSQSDLHNEFKAQNTDTEPNSASNYDTTNNMFANEERLRTPYGMSTREKTYFTSGSFDRPKSATDASPRKPRTPADGRTSSRLHGDSIYISDEDEELSFVSERKVPADPDFGNPNRRDRKSGASVSSAEKQRRHSHAPQSSKNGTPNPGKRLRIEDLLTRESELDSDADFTASKPSRVKTDFDTANTGSTGQPYVKSSIFSSFTNKPTRSTPVSQKPSVDSIDLKFSPSQFAGKFSASNEGYFDANPASIANRRKASPRKRAPPANIPVPQNPIPGGFSEVPQTDEEERPGSGLSQPGAASGTFSSDDWSKHFNEQTWAAPVAPMSRPGATVRAKSSAGNSSTGRKTFVTGPTKSAGLPQVTDDEFGDEAPRWASEAPEPMMHRRVSDENAMDVDPPTEPEPFASMPASTVPSQVGGNASTVSSNINSDGKVSDADVQSVPIIDLTDLGKQPPFAPSQTGLGDLKDLNTTLPFQSRPSPRGPPLPARSPNPRPLHLPQPPLAPMSPMDYVPEEDRAQSIGPYLNRVARYMRDWNHYNLTMISHFQERATKAQNLPESWCQTLDHGIMYTILASYKADVEEDFIVRDHWEKSWTTHLRVLQDLEAVKKWSLTSKGS